MNCSSPSSGGSSNDSVCSPEGSRWTPPPRLPATSWSPTRSSSSAQWSTVRWWWSTATTRTGCSIRCGPSPSTGSMPRASTTPPEPGWRAGWSRFARPEPQLLGEPGDGAGPSSSRGAEHPLRARVDVHSRRPLAGVRLVCSLVWFWGWVGFSEEANRWLRTAPDRRSRRRDARQLAGGHGAPRLRNGGPARRSIAADEAARCWEASGSPESGFATLIYQGLSQRTRRELDAAATTLDRAIDIARGPLRGLGTRRDPVLEGRGRGR